MQQRQRRILSRRSVGAATAGVAMVERLESDANAASEARLKDKRYIDELEMELRNCSQEIEYLQDQVNLRTIEANCMSEQVHSLELKLAEVQRLNEKLRLLVNDLENSDSKCLVLIREVKRRERELQNSALHVDRLETELSSIALESQCEIESMKLDIAALEQRCLEAEEAAQDRARMDSLVEEFECKFRVAQERINFLEKENVELKEKLASSEKKAKGSSCKSEHLHNWLKVLLKMSECGSDQDILVNLRDQLRVLGTCEEVSDPFLSELATVTAWDTNIKNGMEKMPTQIPESERRIKQLKEELREEKRRAKEEAEDLIQAMAELRYQMTDMLEEECKRRASIEQASLQRIQDLEAQVLREQKKSSATLRHFENAQKRAEMRSMEVRHLKNALEELQSNAKLQMPPGTESCNGNYCVDSNCMCCSNGRSEHAEACDYIENGGIFQQNCIEWYPDETPPVEGQDESEQWSKEK